MMKVLIASMFICAMGLRRTAPPELKAIQSEKELGTKGQYSMIKDSLSSMGHGTIKMSMEAIREYGKKESELSDFAKSMVKVPKSLVDEILALKNTTKRSRKYNFVGRMVGTSSQEKKARKWAVDFAKEKFSEEEGDVFVATRTYGPLSSWTPLGTWDKTLTIGDRKTHEEKATKNPNVKFDSTYWNLLLSSEFTLCPGGDDHFSFRAYEATLAGSICIIKNEQDDWRPSIPTQTQAYKNIERVFKLFKYTDVDKPHVYDQSVADHNLDIFIKYFTFIEGDNTPP